MAKGPLDDEIEDLLIAVGRLIQAIEQDIRRWWQCIWHWK